jgi:Flp pilus assembly protein TadG
LQLLRERTYMEQSVFPYNASAYLSVGDAFRESVTLRVKIGSNINTTNIDDISMGLADPAAEPGVLTMSVCTPNRPKGGGRRLAAAQAMVEFALALPVFLLVVYGLLETGRLIFTYAAVTTASREAVRYASAWGINGSGDQQYLDCAGIREAAKQVGFLLNLSDTNIQIYYDDETPAQTPPPTLTEYCLAGGAPVQTGLVLNSGDRVLVTVTARYTLLVPLVPLSSRTISSGPSARTLMGEINLNTPTP